MSDPKKMASNQSELALTPIKDPTNLLGEAITRMSPEQQAKIIGQATDEFLRLQVKQAETEMDARIARDKMANMIAGARMADGMNSEHMTEHRSEHGHSYVKIKTSTDLTMFKVAAMIIAIAIALKVLQSLIK